MERKKITVTAEHKEKIEGQPDPELTVIIDGLVPGDPEDIIDYTIDREPGEEPGDYPIHVDGDPEQGNYIVEFEPGTLTIHKNVSPVDIIVEVGWDDRNDLEGIRPATTTVYLYGNDELFGTVELGPNGYAVQKTIDETWSYTFFNMPRVDVNLEDIVYRVEEQRTDVLTGVDGPGTYAITEEEVEPYHFFIIHSINIISNAQFICFLSQISTTRNNYWSLEINGFINLIGFRISHVLILHIICGQHKIYL